MATVYVRENKNLADLTYVAGDTIVIRDSATLTVSATPSVRPGSIICNTIGKFRIENSSTTIPLVFSLESYTHDFTMSGNAVWEIDGKMIEVGTGTGALQTFDFNTLLGGAYDNVTYIEVETGVGTGVYQPWIILPASVYQYTNTFSYYGGTNPAQIARYTRMSHVMFYDFAANTLSTGDGTTYGSVVPVGAKVRVPNIQVRNKLISYAAQRWYIKSLGTPTGGTVTFRVYNGFTGAPQGTFTIPYNATGAQVKTGLEGIIGAGNVTVTTAKLPTTIGIDIASTADPIVLVTDTQALTGGTTQRIYPEILASDRTVMSTSSGVLSFKNCMFSSQINGNITAPRAVSFDGVGLVSDRAGYIVNMDGDLTLRRFCITSLPHTNSTTGSLSNITGVVTIENSYFWTNANACISIAGCPNVPLIKDSVFVSTPISYGGYSLAIGSVSSTLIQGCETGGRLLSQYSSDIKFVGNKLSDSNLKLSSQFAMSGIDIVVCTDIIVAGLTNAGESVPLQSVVKVDVNSKNVKIFNVDYDCKDITRIGVSLQGSDNGVSNCKFWNVGYTTTSGVINTSIPYAYNATINNVLATTNFSNVSFSRLGSKSRVDGLATSITGFTESMPAMVNFCGGHYLDLGTTPTTGNVIFGSFGAGETLELIGGSYTDQVGDVCLSGESGSVTMTLPFLAKGITSFDETRTLTMLASLQGAELKSYSIRTAYATSGTLVIRVRDTANGKDGNVTIVPSDVAANITDIVSNINAILSPSFVSRSGVLSGELILKSASDFSITVVSSSLLNGDGESVPPEVYANGLTVFFDESKLHNAYRERVRHYASLSFDGELWSDWTSGDYSTDSIMKQLNAIIDAKTTYDPGDGLMIRMKFEILQPVEGLRLRQINIPTLVDTSKISDGNASVTIDGLTEGQTCSVRLLEDDSLLYTFYKNGENTFNLGSNFGERVYFERVDVDNHIVVSDKSVTKDLTFGDNGDVLLFSGSKIALLNGIEILDTMKEVRRREDIINRNVQKASLLIPASEDFE